MEGRHEARVDRAEGGLAAVITEGDPVKFIEWSGRERGAERWGHVASCPWPHLYTAIHAEDGHLRTVATCRLLPA